MTGNKFTKQFHTLTGWIGVLLILTGYMLITFAIIRPDTLLYGVINAFGAIGIMISSYAKRDFQPVFLNVVWLIVALVGIIRSLL